jgi:hypothetical protein
LRSRITSSEETVPTAEIDSRSSPYQFLTVDCLTAAL